MLDEIDSLAQQYVLEESNRLVKHAEYIECIYKITMARMQLIDLTAFLNLIMHEEYNTIAKAYGNFLCVLIHLEPKGFMDPVPRRLGFINDEFYVHLDFCKIRECSESHYDNIYDYYNTKYGREDMIIICKS